MKKKVILITSIIIVLILLSGIVIYSNNKEYFINIDYNEVMEKVKKKDSFVLCLSATDCSHCQNYKPKLEKIANRHRTNIYYADVDLFDEDDYNKFKTDFGFDGSTPTTLFIIDGEEETTATRLDGDVSTDKIINKLKKYNFIK